MSGVNFPTTPNPTNIYLGGTEGTVPTEGSKNVGAVGGNTVIPEETDQNSKVSNRGFTPDTPKADTDMSALRDWMVATPSPGAMLAALFVKEAAQQNEINNTELLNRGEVVQKKLNEQADNIKAAALKQMIGSIVGSAVSGTFSAVAGVKTLNIASGTEGLALQQSMVAPNNWTQAGKSFDQTANAIGGYLNAREQADNKKIDAVIEQNRTMMESIKTSMQAQRDLMSKSLEFMSSMQANINQTMSRIMG